MAPSNIDIEPTLANYMAYMSTFDQSTCEWHPRSLFPHGILNGTF